MLDKSVIDKLKRVDPDRYRAAMFAEQQDRVDLLVVYAFHAELAKVPELVSEPMIGAIRYQWWRDALEEIFSGNTVRKHEVATPLADVIKRRYLSRYHLDQLIDGRERDLDPTPFKSIDDARDYCRATSGQLMRLASQCCDEDINDQDNALILSLGEIWGLTGLLRSWRHYSGSMLSGIKREDLLKLTKSLYSETSASVGKTSPNRVPSIVYTALVPKFLIHMSKPGFDPANDAVHYSVLSKQIRLMRSALSGRL